MEEIHNLHKACLNDPASISKKEAFKNLRGHVQSNLRKMRDSWLSNKTIEIQRFADSHDLKNFYQALKAVYGPTSAGSVPLLAKDGSTLITDKNQILQRWAGTL